MSSSVYSIEEEVHTQARRALRSAANCYSAAFYLHYTSIHVYY